MEHTGNNASAGSGTAIVDGADISLVNSSGVGKLYLWLGGSIPVTPSAEQGDYTGDFSITEAYN